MKKKKRLLRLAAILLLGVLAYLVVPPIFNYLSGRYWTWHRGSLQEDKQGKERHTYYVSSTGNDANDGYSPQRAWRTLARASAVKLNPGDSLLLEGGSVFPGTLKLNEDDLGAPGRLLYVGSWGKGPAVIEAGHVSGLEVLNTEYLHISGITIKGSGHAVNRGHGLAVVNDMRGDIKLKDIRIDNIHASGFGHVGILVEGKKTKSGFIGVSITRCTAFDNAEAGIYVRGKMDLKARDYAHGQVTITHCQAFNNHGRPKAKLNTGSGIVLSDTDKGRIEYCVAYHNGELCRSFQGGPVGIWAWDARDVVIQYNESYGNKTGGIYDGGGFDLDGGCVNSVLQYNYSHDNEGSGLFLAQFYWARKHTGNIVRYNISENDGRKNGYSGLDVWGEVEDALIYNNTVIVGTAPHDTASAFLIRPNREMGIGKQRFPRNIVVANNNLIATGNVRLVRSTYGSPSLTMINNNYYSTTGSPVFNWNLQNYGSLADWRRRTGQEKEQALEVEGGLNTAGLMTAAGLAGSGLLKYGQKEASAVTDRGIEIHRRFNIDPVQKDILGTPLPQGAAPDIGAVEFRPGVDNP